MSQGQLELYKQALDFAGARASIDSPNENSNEADWCNTHYYNVRRNVLRAAFWPCAKGTERLGLLSSRNTANDWVDSEPKPPWTYAYALPAGSVAFRHLSHFQKFELGWYATDNVNCLFTDYENAIGSFTFDQTNIAAWDAGLFSAVAHGLAAAIARPVTGSIQSVAQSIQIANSHIIEARQQSSNEENNDHAMKASWHAARSGGIASEPHRQQYIAPYGPLLSYASLTA